MLTRTNKTYLDLIIERDNNVFEERVNCSEENFKIDDEKEYLPSYTIKDSITYINPSGLETGDIDDIMKKAMDTKGLIVDLRYYNSDYLHDKLGKYLMPKPVEFAKLSTVNVSKPGEFLVTSIMITGKDNPNYYKGKVIILINKNSISQSEFTTMALRGAPKATVVGSNSYGAGGNMSKIILPGGIETCISGSGVYYTDGSEIQK